MLRIFYCLLFLVFFSFSFWFASFLLALILFLIQTSIIIVLCFNERTRLGFGPGFHKLNFRNFSSASWCCCSLDSLPGKLVRNRGILNRLCHGGLDCRNMATQFARSLVRNPAVLRQSWCERWVLRDFLNLGTCALTVASSFIAFAGTMLAYA